LSIKKASFLHLEIS